MSRFWESPVPPVLLLLGCAALGYLALHQRTEIVRVDLEFKAADQAAGKRLAELRRQLASVQADQLQAEKLAAQAAQPRAASGERLTIHASDVVKDHPEYAAIMAREQRRDIMRQYGAGFDSLHLRPDQLARLKDLLVERNLTSTDAQQGAKAAGLEQNTPAYWAAIKQATDTVDQELTSVLGTNCTSALQKLQMTANAQRQIQYYASDFEQAGAPLTPEQSSALAQAFMGARNGPAKVGFYEADPATGLSPSDNRMMETAAPALSPAQLQVMKTDLMHANQQSAILNPYFKEMTGPNRSISIQP